ncbi:hypothetical protein [Bacillus sp. UNCCL81]|uniref:hypothetical protein n=1 Tax=Bacillus sp. UNCCL81 TaxID=1502755 RepID=UPI0008E61085|nr:hypothetical protein [Bacillus sp. UNCCL81]SFC42324.1 hypothetical protein SAMN02799633_00757 [Bacillus sp. UNCCL81]
MNEKIIINAILPTLVKETLNWGTQKIITIFKNLKGNKISESNFKYANYFIDYFERSIDSYNDIPTIALKNYK